jgi:hypothetical protein
MTKLHRAWVCVCVCVCVHGVSYTGCEAIRAPCGNGGGCFIHGNKVISRAHTTIRCVGMEYERGCWKCLRSS